MAITVHKYLDYDERARTTLANLELKISRIEKNLELQNLELKNLESKISRIEQNLESKVWKKAFENPEKKSQI